MRCWAYIVITVIALFLITSVAAEQIESSIEEKLNSDGEADVIVILKDVNNAGHQKATLEKRKKEFGEAQERVISNLKKPRAISQAGVTKKISEKPAFSLGHRFSTINGFSGKISKDGIEELEQNPEVERVYINGEKHVILDQSIPLINASKAFSLAYNGINLSGEGETVCIVDTGVYYNHPNLGNGWGKVVIDGYNSITHEGCADLNSACNDDHGHGTHVAGIVASNDSSYKGAAPGAKIIAIKACNSNGVCADADIMAGIDWCVSNASILNISVISLSLGSDEKYDSYCNDDVLAQSINAAVGQNISVVVATGNSGNSDRISSPACVQNATPVAASNDEDSIAAYSDRSSIVQLVAPGSLITSTSKDGEFIEMSGTSMAAPHVSGAIALINQYMRLQENRKLTASEAEDKLNDTGKAISDGSNTYRRINVYAALLELDTIAPNISFASPTPANLTQINSSSVFINISSNEALSSAILEWSGINETLSGSAGIWSKNKTGLSNGAYTYRAYGIDPAGNVGASQTFLLFVNNSPPNITSVYPSGNLTISEPNSQIFNITYFDPDGQSISISWHLNGAFVSSFYNYTFLGNYSSSGTYNVAVNISDGSLSSSFEWILNITNTNRLPNASSVSINCSDTLNRTNGTLSGSWTFNDADGELQQGNETRWYNNSYEMLSLRNLTYVGDRNTTKLQNWTFSVRAFDGLNWSIWYNSSIFFVKNSDPALIPISNISINETDWANITVAASDIDGDALNYSINDSRFNKSNNIFRWRTNTSNSGIITARITVSDSMENSSQAISIEITDQPDTDNDGIIDVYDPDDDNDGILDENDFLKGNLSNINTSLSNIMLTINASGNLSKMFSSDLPVKILNGSEILVEFNFTFSNSSELDLSNMTIIKNEQAGVGSVLVKGININGQSRKTFFLDNLTAANGVCIKDSQISSISEISNGCNGTKEIFLGCPGTISHYTCELNGTKLKIGGLNHSGVRQANDTQAPVMLSYTPASTDSSSNTLTITTDENASCRYSTSSGINFSAMASLFADMGTMHTASVSTSSSGDYVFYVKCNDTYGNINQADYSAGISASIASLNQNSGSGGGGGSGGVSSVSEFEASKFYSVISPSMNLPMYINKDKIAFTKIGFGVSRQAKKVRISVTSLNDASNAPLGIGNVIQYLMVNISELSEQDIINPEIEFRVNKSLVLVNGEESLINLYRFNNGWQKLDTQKIKDTENYLYYLSKTPGFSYFAIKKETAEDEVQPNEKTGEATLPEYLNQSSESIIDNSPEYITTEKEPEKQEPQKIKSQIIPSFQNIFLAIFILSVISSLSIILIKKFHKKPVEKTIEKHKKKRKTKISRKIREEYSRLR